MVLHPLVPWDRWDFLWAYSQVWQILGGAHLAVASVLFLRYHNNSFLLTFHHFRLADNNIFANLPWAVKVALHISSNKQKYKSSQHYVNTEQDFCNKPWQVIGVC
jgi:hypothetical protein